MPVTFSADDLGRVFEARTLTRGRSLVLIGSVQVSLTDDAVNGVIGEGELAKSTSLVPRVKERRVMFDAKCTCGQPYCVHLAATALAGLDRFPALRKAEQKTFLDNLTTSPEQERQRLVFDVGPGPTALFLLRHRGDGGRAHRASDADHARPDRRRPGAWRSHPRGRPHDGRWRRKPGGYPEQRVWCRR